MIRLTRLSLADFRSYATLDLACDAAMVALAGDNGAGKTNILEAISLFAAGRGLRRADFADMARRGGAGGFAISAAIVGALGEARLGAGLEAQPEGGVARISRIDRAPVGSASAFADHLRLVWLTPEQDGLFRGPAGDRRRFLDRLVLAIDSGHAARASALERALRGRNRLLEDGAAARWLDAVEREAAELAIAVTASRAETAGRLAAAIAATRDDASPFPHAWIALDGEIERLLAELGATEAEEKYRALLREGRERDRAAGRTLVGPQASDLLVRHGPKDIEARLASTGEQKALLVGLILAHAGLVATMSGIAPVVLLDEVAAHLDPLRRAALYTRLDGLGGQVWMTGADPGLFEDLPSGVRLMVTPGQVAAIK